MSDKTPQNILANMGPLLPESVYKDIHSHPELSMQETRTAGIAAERRFDTRKSPLSGSQRLAVKPANAILNYLYAIFESESRLAPAAVGLDPGLGVISQGFDAAIVKIMLIDDVSMTNNENAGDLPRKVLTPQWLPEKSLEPRLFGSDVARH